MTEYPRKLILRKFIHYLRIGRKFKYNIKEEKGDQEEPVEEEVRGKCQR